jgi:hypothetical protein
MALAAATNRESEGRGAEQRGREGERRAVRRLASFLSAAQGQGTASTAAWAPWRAMCAPVPVPAPAPLAAPGSLGPLGPLPTTRWPGQSGQGRCACTPPAPESSRPLAPYPRRDRSGVAGAATPTPPATPRSQGPLAPRPRRDGSVRAGRRCGAGIACERVREDS